MSQRGKRIVAQMVVVVLFACMMGGCSRRTAEDLPPGADSYPKDYESMLVAPSISTTLDDHSPLYHTLYSSTFDHPCTTRETKWCSVDPSLGKLQVGRAHNGEYHAGWAYFLTEPTYDKSGHLVTTSPLYACNSSGKTTTIIKPSDIPGIDMYDFSVSPDGRYVILYDNDSNQGVTSLYLWSVERHELVHGRSPWKAENGCCWDIPAGNGAWHESADASGNPIAYEYIATAISNELPMNVHSYHILTFDASLRKISEAICPVPKTIKFSDSILQIIDPDTETVAYDDYPMFLEYGTDLFNFDKARVPTHLFLYSIRAGASVCIDTRPACRFLPQWVGAHLLAYNIASDPAKRPAKPLAADPCMYVTKYVSFPTSGK